MTFKGAKFESILEIWQVIKSNECLLKCLELELETKRKKRDIDCNEYETRVNLTRKLVEALNELLDDLVDKINLLSASLSDIETEIFLKKFILGEENDKIMSELNISSSNLYRHYDHINDELEQTTNGKELLETLKKHNK